MFTLAMPTQRVPIKAIRSKTNGTTSSWTRLQVDPSLSLMAYPLGRLFIYPSKFYTNVCNHGYPQECAAGLLKWLDTVDDALCVEFKDEKTCSVMGINKNTGNEEPIDYNFDHTFNMESVQQ